MATFINDCCRIIARGKGLTLLLVLSVVGSQLQAQSGDIEPLPIVADSPNAIISLTAGWTGTSARNDFPSLIVGNSLLGSGLIPSAYAQTGSGHAIGLEGLIYFNDVVGLTLGFASVRSSAEYRGDTALLPTTFELQEALLLLGGHVDFGSMRRTGPAFRSLYLEGGFEFGLGVIGNRVTSSGVADTTTGIRAEAIGSFEGGEPFRNRVALRFGIGTMVDLSGNYSGQGLSLIAEAGYSYALNPVFSSDVVRDNSFKTNHLILQAGLGYRF